MRGCGRAFLSTFTSSEANPGPQDTRAALVEMDPYHSIRLKKNAKFEIALQTGPTQITQPGSSPTKCSRIGKNMTLKQFFNNKNNEFGLISIRLHFVDERPDRHLFYFDWSVFRFFLDRFVTVRESG